MAKRTRANKYRDQQAAENKARKRREYKDRKKERDAARLKIAEKGFSREEESEVVKVRRAMDTYGKPTHTYIQKRADRLLAELYNKKARFLTANHTIQLLNLCQTEDWVRPLEDWTPRGRSPISQFRSLVRHLLCEYPVPSFLFVVFDLDPRDRATTKWLMFYMGVGRGGSAFKLAKSYLDIRMSKKMVHRFMQTVGQKDLLWTLRRVQVENFSDDPTWARRLHAAMMATALGRPKPHEDFWETVIQWFARQPMLDPATVGPLIDYIGFVRGENADWSLKGRTVVSLSRDMEQWHVILHKLKKVNGATFEPSGFTPGMWRTKRTDKGGGEHYTYTITEILSTKKLASEGREMKHCVYSYGRSIHSGRCSIWSLRRHESFREEYYDEKTEKMKTRWVERGDASTADRLLTIEVLNKQNAIVQVRGRLNRTAKKNEMAWVNKWAGENDLRTGRAW